MYSCLHIQLKNMLQNVTWFTCKCFERNLPVFFFFISSTSGSLTPSFVALRLKKNTMFFIFKSNLFVGPHAASSKTKQSYSLDFIQLIHKQLRHSKQHSARLMTTHDVPTIHQAVKLWITKVDLLDRFF